MAIESHHTQAHPRQNTANTRDNRKQGWMERMLFATLSAIVFVQSYLGFLLWSQPTAHEWLLGEWFINYQGGFVRRGLIGEILWQISHWLALDIIKLTIITQITTIIIFVVLVYLLIHQTDASPSTVILLFSPAFLLFMIFTWPHLGVRKEVLFGILLCLQLLVLRKSTLSSIILPLLTGIGAVLVILSHEMLVLYLPYLLMATVSHEQGFGRLSRMTSLALLPAIIIAGMIIRAPQADPATINAICASLQTAMPRDCTEPNALGSITFLGATTQQGMQFTRSYTTAETTTVYLVTGLLSAVPIIVTITTYRLWQYLSRNALAFIGGLWGLSLIATAPLFIVAADYGRFINIHVTCTTLILAQLIYKQCATFPPALRNNTALWIGSMLFIVSWQLPIWLMFATYERAFPWLALFGWNN